MLNDSEPTSDLSRSKSRQKSTINNGKSQFDSINELTKAQSRKEKKSNEKLSMNPTLHKSRKLPTQFHDQIIVKGDNESTKS
jgi:hypothetical protein